MYLRDKYLVSLNTSVHSLLHYSYIRIKFKWMGYTIHMGGLLTADYMSSIFIYFVYYSYCNVDTTLDVVL